MKPTMRFFPYLIAIGITIYLISRHQMHEYDTRLLIGGVKHISASLRLGQRSWEEPPTGPADTPVFHYPIFQYVPGLLFHSLGASDRTINQLFCVISAFCFVGSIGLTVYVLRRRSRLAAALGALVLATGPLFWYSRSTFGEMLAVFLILAYTAAMLRGAGPLCTFALFVLAGLTKETALPFLLLIAGVCLLMERRAGRHPPRARVAALFAAALVTVFLSAGFNLFRFGTPHNVCNLQDVLLVSDTKTRLSFFTGIWLSPHGGFLFYWTSFVSVLCGIAYVTLKSPARGSFPDLLPLAGVAALLFGLTLGFSKWYAPFGWIAWGPRLMLPWIPSALLLLLAYYSESLPRLLSEVCASRWRRLTATAILFLASLPNAAVLTRPDIMDRIFSYKPGQKVAVIQHDRVWYYEYMQQVMWPRPTEVALKTSYGAALTDRRTRRMCFWYALMVFGLCWQVGAEVARLRPRSGADCSPGISGPTPFARCA